MLARKSGCQLFYLCGLLQFNIQRERVPMEDGGLQQHQRRYHRLIVHQAPEVALDKAFHRLERWQRMLTITVQKIEGHLRIEYPLGKLLEGKQVDSLLM